MPGKRLVLCGALLVVSASAFAQSKATAAPLESSLWDHNGSVVSLLAQGSAREFRYKELRPGMLDAGARPGALLFRGKVENGQFAGTAFMFDRRCGQLSYPVSGPILDNYQRVVLTGDAPLVGAKCRVQGSFTEVLEFRLQNANKAARTAVPESAPVAPLQSEERAAPPVPAPPAPPRETHPAAPNPPAVVAELAPAQTQAAAPSPQPLAPPSPAATADHALAQKQAAAPPTPAAAAKADLAAEIERTRAAREQASAAGEAARAAELAAHRAFAEAEATRAAADARLQQSRDDLQTARDDDSEGRFPQTLVLVALLWMLLLSGVTIVLLFIKLRRSRSPREAENPKAADASRAPVFELPLYSRWSEIAAKADAANAPKSRGYQSSGRMRVFFQTRPAHH